MLFESHNNLLWYVVTNVETEIQKKLRLKIQNQIWSYWWVKVNETCTKNKSTFKANDFPETCLIFLLCWKDILNYRPNKIFQWGVFNTEELCASHEDHFWFITWGLLGTSHWWIHWEQQLWNSRINPNFVGFLTKEKNNLTHALQIMSFSNWFNIYCTNDFHIKTYKALY